ncbi:MAG: hypothetical protein EAZ85_12645 [Bacteroidetes bacterium]|nr:MAG: hypothetical protein EAZ85_12645 [Bacteroidota bacterium]
MKILLIDKKMKSFEKWETEELILTFGIKPKNVMQKMQIWLEANFSCNETEQIIIDDLRNRLLYFVDYWNEQDLKSFFILPIINMIDFSKLTKYRTFMEHTFAANLKDINGNEVNLRGRVEMVVATGEQRPRIPFFFLNEYKAQLKAITDPKGQLLVAMLAAQTKNNGINLPIYGMYNIGQNFFFLILEGDEYAISKQFDATDKQDLEKIISMLKFVKNHIENFINQLK